MLQKQKIDNKLKKIERSWSTDVIAWYRKNKRVLPWRKRENQNFYSIWISEVMLQQTNVNTVIPYYEKFKKKWPDLRSFQSAKFDEIMMIWQGLGYYNRAKNLYSASKVIHNFDLKRYDELLKIPGIGKYTASAIIAILYDRKIGVIDTNIKRVFSRVFSVNFRDSSNKNFIEDIAYKLSPYTNNKLYCQSLMDLGSLICKKKPVCKTCPVSSHCNSFNSEDRFDLKVKKIKPKKEGIVFFIKYKKKIYLEKSEDNFLYGLMRFPTTEFSDTILGKTLNVTSRSKIWLKSKKILKKGKYIGSVNHQFTNFYLKLLIVKIDIKSKNNNKLNGIWINEQDISSYPFSRLMEKVQTVAMGLDD